MSDNGTTHAALVHVMVTTCVADLHMAKVELRAIQQIVNTLPVFAGFDAKRLSAIADETARMLRDANGLDAVLALVKKSLPGKLYDTAYALAVEVASADVTAEQEELRFLEMLRETLDLDPLVTAAIERSARVRYRRV